MYKPNYFKKSTNQKEISDYLKKQGYVPLKISNTAGYEYHAHAHVETKALVGLKGDMQVQVENEHFTLRPGDLLIIDSNKVHRASVGSEGCVFFWAEKLSVN